MSDLAALAEGRSWALSRMHSTARVRRRDGWETQDSSGAEVPQWSPILDLTPCRISGAHANASRSRTQNVALGVEVERALRTAHLPYGTRLDDGDVIEIVGGELVGSFWLVADADIADQQTATRLSVEQIDRPQGW